MFLNKAGKPQGQIGSLIGVGTKITGDISFVGGLRVDGEITGNVSTTGERNGTLVVGEHARMEGKLSASRLLINGKVIGPTISTEFVELQSHAQVMGNVYYNGIAMHPGAVVDGQLVHCVNNPNSGELELVFGKANVQETAA